MLLEHLDEPYGFYGEVLGTRIARKHVAWYAQAHRGAESLRPAVNATESAVVQREAVRAFFLRLSDVSPTGIARAA